MIALFSTLVEQLGLIAVVFRTCRHISKRTCGESVSFRLPTREERNISYIIMRLQAGIEPRAYVSSQHVARKV
jgi:hypothetical protein